MIKYKKIFANRSNIMTCENYLCIYQQNNECTLDKIELDIQGSCQECVYISPSNDVLDREKKKILCD